MILQNAETDWLASKNIFYNIRTNKISNNINDLIDVNHIDFHPEGLCNYLDYGYSVFGQTPIKEIKILPANCKISADSKGKLCVVKKDDPIEKLLGRYSSPEDTLDCLHNSIRSWENEMEGSIILPLSGGFDSRLLTSMVEKKERIRAFTYGLTKNQSESMEVVYAKKLSELLSFSWEQIELGDFHNYFEQWYSIFGVATHAHGMYQMEFYSKIREKSPSGAVLSGIYGDLWAGSWNFSDITEPNQLINLAITHEMNADSQYCKIKGDNELRDCFYKNNKDKLKERNWRIIYAARMKMILISYLMRVPEYYGFKVWSPFLDANIVAMMINLDWKYKDKRLWQIDYFRNNGILIGEMGLKCDKGNILNQIGSKRIVPKPLDVKLLGTIIDEKYVREINANLDYSSVEKKKFYLAYLVLYPIQQVLKLKEYGHY